MRCFFLLCRLENPGADQADAALEKQLQKLQVTSQGTAASPEKQLKELRSEAKEVWKLLKKFKVTQADLSFGQQELNLVQSVISGSTPVNEKLAGEIEAKWKAFERCAPITCISQQVPETCSHASGKDFACTMARHPDVQSMPSPLL